MMDYLILESNSTGGLMIKVEKHIQRGYLPLGGVTISSYVTKKGEYYERTRNTYYQAVLKQHDVRKGGE